MLDGVRGMKSERERDIYIFLERVCGGIPYQCLIPFLVARWGPLDEFTQNMSGLDLCLSEINLDR